MKPILFDLFDEHPLAHGIAKQLNCQLGSFTLRDFPDRETYLQLHDNLRDRHVIMLASLNDPNPKLAPLIFLAETARALGAGKVGLCAPYLAYMRQDTRFNTGEAVTADYYAKLLSTYFDWLVTADPHLHRHVSLAEIYTIPTQVAHATQAIAHWVKQNVSDALLLGPDVESEQWLRSISDVSGMPYQVLQKQRHGDRQVELSAPTFTIEANQTPVIVDDIISTGGTMMAVLQHLQVAKSKPAVCIGIHAIFAGDTYDRLIHAGAAHVITCNSIAHASNAIDLTDSIVEGIASIPK
jgi:ribose-phosphate pyrophosphokinase